MVAPIFSILHLSDLHLGRNFQDAGGPHREPLAAALNVKAYQMQAHDEFLMLLLPLEVSRIANLNRKRFKDAHREAEAPRFFDRVVVSGDISTDATDEERFRFAHSFLTSKLQTTGLYGPQAQIGLNIQNDLLLCIPGNHDKMREVSLSRFNASFGHTPQECNYVQFVKKGKRSIIFIGMDSNAYVEGNIALGEMDEARLSWLADVLLRMQTEGILAGDQPLTVDECTGAIKCLLLHHHVCDLSFKKRWFNPTRSFTKLVGSDRLLKILKDRVQVILHGHEHYPTHFTEKESGAVVVSAGTTSQWHKHAGHNSFYNLLFFNDGTLQIEEYVWNGSGFDSRQDGEGKVPTYRLRGLHPADET